MPKKINKNRSVRGEREWVRFNSKSTEGSNLSNFAPIGVRVNGRYYANGEAAFHGEKMHTAATWEKDNKTSKALREYAESFQGVSDPLTAKRMGGKGGMRLTADQLRSWNAGHSRIIQKSICRYKYTTHAGIRELLADTKDRLLRRIMSEEEHGVGRQG